MQETIIKGNELFQTPEGSFFSFGEEGILEIPKSKAVWQHLSYIPELDKNFESKGSKRIEGITLFGKYTMTMDDYAAYVHDMARQGKDIKMPSDEGWGYRKRPAINLNLYETCHYINWLNQQYGAIAHEHGIKIDLNEDGSEYKILDSWVYFQHRYIVNEEQSEIIRGRIILDDNEKPVMDGLVEKVIIADIVDNEFKNYIPGFQLPNSEEWVVAAGSVQDQTLEDIAWFAENSENMTHPVGEKLPNNFGLYDMLGNVWERVIKFEKD